MTLRKLKIKPDPDFGRLEKVLRRKAVPDRVPFFELFSNIEAEVLEVIGKGRGNTKIQCSTDEPGLQDLKQQIDYMFYLGYDYIRLYPENFEFPRKEAPTAMTDHGEREYFPAVIC